MYGWIKLFADGTEEIGTDEDVHKKQASWSQGRLEDMIGAEIIHGNKRIAIHAPGTFWQSDDYEVTVHQNGEPELKVRRLQKQININDNLSVKQFENSFLIASQEAYLMMHNLVGKWLTLEMNVETGQLSYNIQETMI